MALFAISDLHLALSGDKPMNVFGENWNNHDEKIKTNWMAKVKEQDTVLIAGDISWSMNIEDGIRELQWINELPGNKILIKGNHDYWWSSITKLNDMYDNMHFIQNNYYAYEDYAICGTRGWICPGVDAFTEHDEKIFVRELSRLKFSLNSAVSAGYKKLICMLHYPPTNDKFIQSGFTEIFQEYGVEKVIYGHLHGPFRYRVLNGELEGIQYIITSCDYIDFDPLLILE